MYKKGKEWTVEDWDWFKNIVFFLSNQNEKKRYHEKYFIILWLDFASHRRHGIEGGWVDGTWFKCDMSGVCITKSAIDQRSRFKQCTEATGKTCTCIGSKQDERNVYGANSSSSSCVCTRGVRFTHIFVIYRGRLASQLKRMAQQEYRQRRQDAAILIQTCYRGGRAKKEVLARKVARMNAWLAAARAWGQFWSDDANAFFFYHHEVLSISMCLRDVTSWIHRSILASWMASITSRVDIMPCFYIIHTDSSFVYQTRTFKRCVPRCPAPYVHATETMSVSLYDNAIV
jgi:hypothetical protein